MVVGMLFGTAAMLTLTQLGTRLRLRHHVLPSLILMGIGMGNIFPPAFQSATFGVDRADTGVASAMVNTMQQVGGSIGTALLSSIFAERRHVLRRRPRAVGGNSSKPPPSTATPSPSGWPRASSPSAPRSSRLVVPSIRIQAAHGAEPVTAH